MTSFDAFLRRRSLRSVIALGLVALLIAVALSAAFAWRTLSNGPTDDPDRRMADVARSTAALGALYLAERRAEIEHLATSPTVVAAAEASNHENAGLKLTRPPAGRAVTRTRAAAAAESQAGATATAYLRAVLGRSDFLALSLSDADGVTSVSTRPIGDAVLADDPRWEYTMQHGAYASEPRVDSSTGGAALELAAAVTARASARRLGVLSGVLDLRPLGRLVAAAAARSGLAVAVLDARGRLLLGLDGKVALTPLPDADAIPRADAVAFATVPGPTGPERAVTARSGRTASGC